MLTVHVRACKWGTSEVRDLRSACAVDGGPGRATREWVASTRHSVPAKRAANMKPGGSSPRCVGVDVSKKNKHSRGSLLSVSIVTIKHESCTTYALY